MRVVCADLGTGPVVSSGANSHVDLLAASPPTLTLSKLVNSLTGGSQPADPTRVPRTGAPQLPGQPALGRDRPSPAR
jgi:hypothetical protein